MKFKFSSFKILALGAGIVVALVVQSDAQPDARKHVANAVAHITSPLTQYSPGVTSAHGDSHF